MQGYLAFALQLKKALIRHVPRVNVELVEGPRASFEVDRDGVRMFSKIRKGRLPDFQRLIDEVRLLSVKPRAIDTIPRLYRFPQLLEYDHTKAIHRSHWLTLKSTGTKLGKTNTGGAI